jgi:hypothetical protein
MFSVISIVIISKVILSIGLVSLWLHSLYLDQVLNPMFMDQRDKPVTQQIGGTVTLQDLSPVMQSGQSSASIDEQLPRISQRSS